MKEKNKPKNETAKINGVVEEILPNATFRVLLEDGRKILAHASGKMKMYRIRVLAGDNIIVEMSEYDIDRGRIVRRL